MINRLKDLLWNIGIDCYGVLVITIEIILLMPVLLWAPIVWLSTWIMRKIQGYDCCTVFGDIAIWYIDNVVLAYLDLACDIMWKIFLGKERPDDHFRELTMERLGL